MDNIKPFLAHFDRLLKGKNKNYGGDKREVIKRITKYQLMIHGFEKKYGMNFYEFEKGIKKSKPAFAEEQDYYDWDMATTALEDIEQELQKVRIHLEKKD